MRYIDYLKKRNIDLKKNIPIFAMYKGKIHSMSDMLEESDEEEIIFLSNDNSIANKTYERSLCLLLETAVKNVFNCEIILKIEHSISKGLYCELYREKELYKIQKDDLELISKEMDRLIAQDLEIKTDLMDREEAINLFTKRNDEDKALLLKTIKDSKIAITNLDRNYAVSYGYEVHSTAILHMYKLLGYMDGFVILYPSTSNPFGINPFTEEDKLYEIFNETGDWNRIIGVETVGQLNLQVENNNEKRLIAVSEGLHEKKYSNVADMIQKNKDVKVVLLAGPSSSGKTTSAKRLSIQLMVNGINPIPLEMDNYFVDRDKTPKLPDGSYDFESIEAVDLEKFNEDIKNLIEGNEIDIIKFNFITGKREVTDNKMKLPKDGVLIIEGIHALNPKILSNIESRRKFKIYASALTQLNLDNGNRISTSDVRKLRRIVRDFRTRGYSTEDTLRMFDGVSRGEKIYIFPYQKEADVMLNTTLIYELSVLKKFVMPRLLEIKEDSLYYEEALRLINVLKYINEIDEKNVPDNSVLREFIGNSFFD